MTKNSFSETRKSENKTFIIDNSLLLQKYALKNYEFYGTGIIVINLLLLKSENINELNLLDSIPNKSHEPTVHLPVAYIPRNNFWFKMISLKICRKHKIDLRTESNANKLFVVFIKDDAIEYFSIYTIKRKKALPP